MMVRLYPFQDLSRDTAIQSGYRPEREYVDAR